MGGRGRKKRREARTKPPVEIASAEDSPVLDTDLSPLEPKPIPARPANRQQQSITFTAEQYSGLLPHPQHVERFDEVYPGAAKIIFEEFQAQGTHRRKLESRVVTANLFSSIFGQVLSFILLGGIAAGGIWLIYQGKDAAGFGTIAASVISGLWALKAARDAKKADLANKRGDDRKKK